MRTISITVKGKVQGVFFRKYALSMAEKLAVTGIIKNCNDGSVYIEATGDENSIEQFISWCENGSPFSKVVSVVSVEMDLKIFKNFKVIQEA